MTREYYNSLDIRTLRIKGREVGVKAPTRLKKADLIERIILVESGVAAPVQKEQANKGRPPLKCNLSLNSINYVENEPPKEPIAPPVEEKAVEPPRCEEAHIEQNYDRQPPRYQPQFYQTQYNPRNNEFVLQKIKEMQNMLEEIFDYLIYEGL